MYSWKLLKSISLRRLVIVLLVSLMMTSGLVSTQEPIPVLGMRTDDPTDTDPIGVGDEPPQFQPPPGGFTWSIEKRFGLDKNGDGMIDYHWDPTSMTYDPSYVYPTSWNVTFDGCQTENDHSPFTKPEFYDYAYQWTLDNAILTTVNCKLTRPFTDKSSHPMGLTVTNLSDGSSHTFPDQLVQIKDYFIVSIGDSFASGQGNPDIEQEEISGPFGFGWIMVSPAKWQDERCMRSANAAPALAAIALEASDPHSSVTFISFACTGATIQTPSYDLVPQPDADPLWENRGSGILGPHRGEITDVEWGDYEHYIKPQMQQVEEALAASNGQPRRQIDALLISGGGNDMKFAPIMKQCVLFTDCWDIFFAKMQENPITDTEWYTLYDIVVRALGQWGGDNPPLYTVPGNYADLGARINQLSPKPAHVYVTQYPDPTVNDRGVSNESNETYQHHCRMLDDVLWPNPVNVMTDVEAQIASHHAQTKLNEVIRIAVTDLASTYPDIDWQFVDGMSVFDADPDPAVAGKPGLFVGGPNGGPGHGYCASDNWIRRADESELIQGPVNWRMGSVGTMHPNYTGQQVIKSRILRYMLPDLNGQSPEQSPSFAFSYNSGSLTSQPGLNGWYIRSCDSNGVCFPKVVAQAVAQSTVVLNGASILVNDSSGCNGSVACNITSSADGKQVTYAVEISASGTYRFQFNAQDSSGQVSFLQREIKVDLEDPILAMPIGPFEVDEGSSVVLSAHIATVMVGDPPQEVPINDDVVVDINWDLNNDGIFETLDEQPRFSATDIDGPEIQFIQVQVVDRAGRTATGQSSVNVLDVAPKTVYDDFDDNTPDLSLWSVFQQGGPVASEVNQRLEITLPADSVGDQFGARYNSVCKLHGDFDIQVDYELLTWPIGNGVRIGLSTSFGNIERVSFGSSPPDFAGGPEVYLTDFTGLVKGITSTADRSGKLRLARVGDTLTGLYFGNSGWITIADFTSANTEDTAFALGSWSHDPVFADQEVKLAFDNLVINKGELVCPPLDTTPPTITLTTPAEGAVYLLGQTVNADYACQDETGGSGLASCAGDIPNGSLIDSGSIGAKTFTVNSTDNANNTASVTRSYQVIYNFIGFTSPVDNPSIMNIAKAGQTIPLKWRITDANGNPVTSLTGVSVVAGSLSCPTAPTTDAIDEYVTSSSGLQNLGDGYYQWNWKSPSNYANSCKTLKLDLGEGAGFEHIALFQFRK